MYNYFLTTEQLTSEVCFSYLPHLSAGKCGHVCLGIFGCALIRNYLPLIQSLLNVPETKVTTLPNGLKVATEDSGGSTCTVSQIIIEERRDIGNALAWL